MTERRTNAIVGAGALLLILVFLYGLFQYLGGTFASGTEVKATFARAGQLLRDGSDVKMRGVLVGTVTKIEVEVGGSGRAQVTMLLKPEQPVPSNVRAAIRAKTLFGEKFIDLLLSGTPAGRIKDGAVIPQSRTIPPIEVETILEKGVPVLDAVDPEAFGSSLHALAQAFTGNEDELRHATLQSEKLLTETERTLPNLERNLVHLKYFASALNQTDTDLLTALDGLSKVGQVIKDNPDAFKRTVSGLVPLARDLGDILTARQSDLGDIAGKGAAVLKVVADRANTLPGTVNVLDDFLSVWVKDLTPGPNWRISETDPPIVTGDPYGAGEAPKPNTVLIAKLAGNDPGIRALVGVLLAPVTEPVAGVVERLNPLLTFLAPRGPR